MVVYSWSPVPVRPSLHVGRLLPARGLPELYAAQMERRRTDAELLRRRAQAEMTASRAPGASGIYRGAACAIPGSRPDATGAGTARITGGWHFGAVATLASAH